MVRTLAEPSALGDGGTWGGGLGRAVCAGCTRPWLFSAYRSNGLPWGDVGVWQSGATLVWVSHEMGFSGTDPCARPGLGLPE